MKTFKAYFYLFPTFLLSLTVVLKLFELTQRADKLPRTSLAENLLPLAILEIICIVLFVIPRTMNIGFLLICSYLGGAIAVNIFTDYSNPFIPASFLALFWIGMYFKRKDLFIN